MLCCPTALCPCVLTVCVVIGGGSWGLMVGQCIFGLRPQAARGTDRLQSSLVSVAVSQTTQLSEVATLLLNTGHFSFFSTRLNFFPPLSARHTCSLSLCIIYDTSLLRGVRQTSSRIPVRQSAKLHRLAQTRPRAPPRQTTVGRAGKSPRRWAPPRSLF